MPNHFHPIVLGPSDSCCRASPPHRAASRVLGCPRPRVQSADSTPPANVSHGEAPVGGTNAPPAPIEPRLPPLERGRLHRLRLETKHVTVTVAPGITYAAWTFNGGVPGPVLHVLQGDTVDVTLINRSNTPHSMDFHAAEIAPNKYYVNVMPGDSLHYRFVARVPGAFMYHCGTAPAAIHIANGMYGALVVDPATPRPQGEGVRAGPERVLLHAEDRRRRRVHAQLAQAPRHGAGPRGLQRPGVTVCGASDRRVRGGARAALRRERRPEPDLVLSRGRGDLRAGVRGRVCSPIP